MNKHIGIRIVSLIMGFLLIVGIILCWVDLFCFDKNFYDTEYEKLETAKSIGISEAKLSEATGALLDYLKGKRDDLVVKINFFGVEREVFDARETAHMKDVRDLYRGAMLTGYLCLGLGAAYFVFTFIFGKKLRPALCKGYIYANWVFLALVVGIGIFALTDFNTFWTGFHHIFFRNDLWLLDPRTEILIQMVPSQFFFDLVMRIVIASLVSLAVLLAAALVLNAVYNKNKEKKQEQKKKSVYRHVI